MSGARIGTSFFLAQIDHLALRCRTRARDALFFLNQPPADKSASSVALVQAGAA